MAEGRRKFNPLTDIVMNIAPLLEAPLAIQIHVATVLPAAIIGPLLFVARKGTPRHRLMGKVWLGLMALSALSSFFIHSINLFAGFSPIHLLSGYVLVGCWLAYRSARTGRIRQHKMQVIGLYLGGIIGAGGFTLLPGRIMHAVVFTWPTGAPDGTGLMIFLALMAGAVLVLFALSRIFAPKRAVGPEHV
jgi:uncharacterized membrane protein